MGAPASLLPELEDVVQHGLAEKRAETLRLQRMRLFDEPAHLGETAKVKTLVVTGTKGSPCTVIGRVRKLSCSERPKCAFSYWP